jgi:hypothetical protein
MLPAAQLTLRSTPETSVNKFWYYNHVSRCQTISSVECRIFFTEDILRFLHKRWAQWPCPFHLECFNENVKIFGDVSIFRAFPPLTILPAPYWCCHLMNYIFLASTAFFLVGLVEWTMVTRGLKKILAKSRYLDWGPRTQGSQAT